MSEDLRLPSLNRSQARAIARQVSAERRGDAYGKQDGDIANRVLRVLVAMHPEFFPKKRDGVCFVCGCTTFDACPDGCGWSDAPQAEGRPVLCTACAPACDDTRPTRRKSP